MQGRVVVGTGTGRSVGAVGGAETHTLTIAEMPKHRHGGIKNYKNAGRGDNPGTEVDNAGKTDEYSTDYTGNSNSHNNMQPYIVLNYIIKY